MPEEPKPGEGKPNNEPAPAAGSDGTLLEGKKPPAEGEPAKPVEGEPAKPVVPEKYENFSVPEGVELDADVLKNFEAAARDMGLTQENAQKLVNFGVGLVEAGVKSAEDNRTETLTAWEKEIKEDTEFGGDKLEETLDRGRRVIRDHGSKELHELLEVTGLGSNPHVLKFLAKLDKALGEDKAVDGKPAPGEAKDAATVLYDGK